MDKATSASLGMAHLSLIPVRTEPSDKSELCTQLLFGETYQVLEESSDGKWLKIEGHWDAYQGWMDWMQFCQAPEGSATGQELAPRSTDVVAWLQSKSLSFPILLGSSLPQHAFPEIYLGQMAYKFMGKYQTKPLTEASQIIEMAFKYLHAPYLWGGRSPLGIDCSGFTQQVWKLAGYRLERDSNQQVKAGEAIADLAETRSLDLAFFGKEDKVGITHVGIIIHPADLPSTFMPTAQPKIERYIIHALGAVRVDQLDKRGIFHLDQQIYTHQLRAIKRLEIALA